MTMEVSVLCRNDSYMHVCSAGSHLQMPAAWDEC